MKLLCLLSVTSLVLLSACVPSEDIASSSSDSQELGLTVTPSFLTLKRNDETRITISGGAPPYQVTVTDDALGSAYIDPGATIASVFSKPNFTGNFSVKVTDSAGNKVFATVDITDGFQVFPKSRQTYPGRKIQITPLEGDLTAYSYRLLQGGEAGVIDANGLLSVSYEAANNTLIAVEIENNTSGEKEKSFIYVRDQLDSENITLGVGLNHTCLAYTNVSNSSSNLQCWGSRAYGALAEADGLIAKDAPGAAENTKIITSLATQYPKNISVSHRMGCATFFNGFYDQTEAQNNNARYIKCWGNGDGSPNKAAGLYTGTMGTALTSYTFAGDGETPLYVKSISRGLDFQCALLTSNLDANVLGSGPNDGEIRCWGIGIHNGEDFNTTSNYRAYLGTNSGVERTLNKVTMSPETMEDFNYNLNGADRSIPNFPFYVHTLSDSLDTVSNPLTHAQYTNPGVFNKVKASHIASGSYHTCAIRANSGVDDGNITCWGYNGQRQVSSGTTAHQYGGNLFAAGYRVTPTNTTFTPPVPATSLFMGWHNSCMIGQFNPTTKRLYCWGRNNYEQSRPGTSTSNKTPNSSMPPTIFRNASGTEESVIAGASGLYHTCVIVNTDHTATKGRVVCFGSNNYGQHGIGLFGGVGKPSDGEYVDLGNQLFNNGTSAPYQAVKLIASDYSTCALLEKTGTDEGHSVKCWGRNHVNQLGYGDSLDRAKASDADGFTIGDGQAIDLSMSPRGGVCALKLNGNLKCWGSSIGGQLGQENFQTTHKNPDDPFNTVAFSDLKTFGMEIKSISSSNYKNCITFKSGHVHCWGHNPRNALGVNTVNNEPVADEPNELNGINSYAGGISVQFKTVSLSANNGCGIDSEDKVRCWGSRYQGVNTDEQNADINIKAENTSPILNFSNKKALKISLGEHHACGLFENALKNHEVHCWGYNYHGQVGKTTATRYVGRYADTRHNENPTPFNDHIQTPVNLDLGAGDKVLDIKAGSYHTCALMEKAGTKEENYVKCWGANNRIGVGEANDPVTSYPTNERWKGTNFVTPKLNLGGENPIQIAIAKNHSCVLFDTEQIKCWGPGNGNGKLGWDAPIEYQQIVAPKGVGYVNLGPGRRATQIFTSAQSTHTCAVLESDDDLDNRYDVKCWGVNNRGQLGQGSIHATDVNNGYQKLQENTSLLKYKID